MYIIIYLDTVYPLYSGNLRQAASDPVEHGYKGTPDISSKLGKALLQDRSEVHHGYCMPRGSMKLTEDILSLVLLVLNAGNGWVAGGCWGLLGWLLL